jgi:hypothetical protein
MDIENEKVDIQDEKVYLYGTDKQNRQLMENIPCYGNRNTNYRTTSKTEFICMKNMLDAIYCLNL